MITLPAWRQALSGATALVLATAAGAQRRPVDLLLTNARIIDVVSGRIDLVRRMPVPAP